MDKILLAHGGGGEEMDELIGGMIFEIFDNEILKEANDSALLNLKGEIAFTTDSYTVSPLEFAGGNIGKIAVCGTVNDLLMSGAEPKYLSCALIIEEGLEISTLKTILQTMKTEADKAGVKIVCGDTKVVPKGSCDKIFINTAGIGLIVKSAKVQNIKPGAKILISGDVGRHGAVIMAARDELALTSDLKSDCKALNKPVLELLKNCDIYTMRDATRGGLSAVLNEWANISNIGIEIKEEKIAVKDEVNGICELLGFEPWDLANEGTFIVAVAPNDAPKALEILKSFDENASLIGEFDLANKGVIIENAYGAKRVLDKPKGELLPRIC